MDKLKVGDRLWFVPNERRGGDPYEVEVRSVGRKWASIAPPGWHREEYRIDITTLGADGGKYSSPGRAYRDRAEYEAKQALFKAWSGFLDTLNRWRPPSHLTASDIAEIQARITGSPQ